MVLSLLAPMPEINSFYPISYIIFDCLWFLFSNYFKSKFVQPLLIKIRGFIHTVSSHYTNNLLHGGLHNARLM